MTEQEQTCRGTPTTPMDLEGPTWPFAESYKEAFGNLPPSQVREAYKRLTTRRRNPLSPEQCAEPSAEVLACLEAVNAAYLSKKQRSKAASASKREATRARPDNVTEPEAAPEAAPVEALADSMAAAEIVAEAEPKPQPAPQAFPPKSAPFPIPGAILKKTVPLAAAEPAATEPVKVPSTPAKKKGLAGRFA